MINKVSNPSLRIRTCEIDDFQTIIVLLKQLWPERNLTEDRLFNVYSEMINSANHHTIVAEMNEKVIGLSTLSIRSSLYAQGHLAHIDELVVDSNHRGKGIGKMFMDYLIRIAKERNCTLIELDTAMHREDAHRFYEKSDFKKTGYVYTKVLMENILS